MIYLLRKHDIRTRPADKIKDFERVPRNLVIRFAHNNIRSFHTRSVYHLYGYACGVSIKDIIVPAISSVTVGNGYHCKKGGIHCSFSRLAAPLRCANGASFTIPWRRRRVPDSSALAFRIPSEQNKKPSVWMVFCFGGEGGIRTHERFYPLHDFQSCALDQLSDFSVFNMFRFTRLVIISQQIAVVNHKFSMFCV